MLVTAVEARPLRSLSDVRVELGEGIVSLIGPNGAGKTNLLEALYFALTGRSFRTADRRELIPFGGQLARAEAPRARRGRRRAPPARLGQPRARGAATCSTAAPPSPPTLPATAHRSRSSRRTGWPWSRARRPSAAPTSTATSPPAGRRAPELRQRYGQALAQRNALLARLAGGPVAEASSTSGTRRSPRPPRRWSRPARRRSTELAPPFADRRRRARARGGATLEYAPRATGSAEEIRAGLAERREADLRLGRTLLGPAPRRAEDRPRRPGPCAATAPRASSAPPCWRCSSPSGRRCWQRTGVAPAAAARRRDERARPRAPRAPGRAARAAAGQALITAAAEESVPPRALDAACCGCRSRRPAALRRGGMSRRRAPRPARRRRFARRARAGRPEDPPRGGPGGSGRRPSASGSRRPREPVSERDGDGDRRLLGPGLGGGAGPDAGAAASSALRERLGDEAPQQFALSCGRRRVT